MRRKLSAHARYWHTSLCYFWMCFIHNRPIPWMCREQPRGPTVERAFKSILPLTYEASAQDSFVHVAMKASLVTDAGGPFPIRQIFLGFISDIKGHNNQECLGISLKIPVSQSGRPCLVDFCLFVFVLYFVLCLECSQPNEHLWNNNLNIPF